MRIRCERCGTTYELDEGRLPARGASVKCTRCQHVFRAVPPGSSAPKPPGAAPEPGPPPSPPAPGEVGAGAAPVPAPGSAAEDRTAVFGYAPPAPPEATASYAAAEPQGPGPTRETPPRPSRPRTPAVHPPPPARRSRTAWVVVAVLAIAAAAVAAWLALRPAAPRARPGAAADAERARALYWLAADARDEALPIEARARALEEDLAREEAARAPGWRHRREEIVSRLQSARAEAEGPRGRASDRRMAADQALASARAGSAAALAIHRAEAIRHVLDRDAAGLDATVLAAAQADASDPWVELARAQAAVDGLRPADVPSLARAVELHPELVRGRVLLARIRHAAGDVAEAIRLLDEALALQPDDESAKAWKARYLAPPPASVSRVQAIGSAPPVLPGGYLPRLRPRS